MGGILASGLCIIRNGIRLDYPFIEAIKSAMPICDEFIVVAGDSDDGTTEALRELSHPRLRIVETVWSKKVRPQCCLLAQQTNIGMHLCQGDWCVYVQANEVLHEKSLPVLRGLMEKHADDARVEAMLLERLSFWGDYDHYSKVYPDRFKFSPRIVRPHIGTYSVRDAMSFAVFDTFSTRGRNPRSIDTGEDIYRYGYVRSLESMTEKIRKAVHTGLKDAKLIDEYFLTQYPGQFIKRFAGSHPAVMAERAAKFPRQYDETDPRVRTKLKWSERQRLLETWYYERFGLPSWRNKRYKLIGGYKPKTRPMPGV